MKFTYAQIKCIVDACCQRDIKEVFVQSYFEDNRYISQIITVYYSGSIQGIMYDVDKVEAEDLIQKIYFLINQNKELIYKILINQINNN